MSGTWIRRGERTAKPRVTLVSMRRRDLIGITCARWEEEYHSCERCDRAYRARCTLTPVEVTALVSALLTASIGLGLGLMAWSVVS